MLRIVYSEEGGGGAYLDPLISTCKTVIMLYIVMKFGSYIFVRTVVLQKVHILV